MPQYREKVIYYRKTREELPLNIKYAGITEKDSNFYLRRKSSNMFIYEYVTDGAGYIEREGVTYRVSAGECFIIPAGESYSYYSDKLNPYRKLWFCGDGSLMQGVYRAYFQDKPLIICRGDYGSLWEEILKRLEVYDDSAERMGEIAELFVKIMSAVYTECFKGTEKQPMSSTLSHDERALFVRNYIDDHLTEKLSLETLAAQVYLTEVQLIRLFKKEFGETPYRYYTDGRLELAENLILNTTLLIKEIAERTGFPDEYYFSYAFRRFKGYTPTSLRKG